MAPPKQALLILGLGVAVCAGIGAYSLGAVWLLSLEAVVLILITVMPLAVLAVAAYVGRNKKAGAGAVGFAWLFLLFQTVLMWNLMMVPGKSTDAIGVFLLIIIETLASSALLAFAFVQRPIARESNDVT